MDGIVILVGAAGLPSGIWYLFWLTCMRIFNEAAETVPSYAIAPGVHRPTMRGIKTKNGAPVR